MWLKTWRRYLLHLTNIFKEEQQHRGDRLWFIEWVQAGNSGFEDELRLGCVRGAGEDRMDSIQETGGHLEPWDAAIRDGCRPTAVRRPNAQLLLQKIVSTEVDFRGFISSAPIDLLKKMHWKKAENGIKRGGIKEHYWFWSRRSQFLRTSREHSLSSFCRYFRCNEDVQAGVCEDRSEGIHDGAELAARPALRFRFRVRVWAVGLPRVHSKLRDAGADLHWLHRRYIGTNIRERKDRATIGKILEMIVKDNYCIRQQFSANHS